MLTPQQIASYHENGFVILRNHFPKSEIAEMRRDLFAILAKPWTGSKRLGIGYEAQNAGKDPENPLGASFVMQSPLLSDRWFKLTLDPRLVEPMIDLLGPDVNLHDQKIPMKPPGHVTHQGWHQDWAYETHDVPELAAVLLYLDETAPGAGATKVAVGSHKRGLIPHTKPNITAILDDLVTEPVEQPSMQPGDAMIIHTLLVHSVGDNHSATTKSMVAHVYKSARAIDTHGNSRAMAELPVARNGKAAMKLMW
jgi:phytanoyl-CoA hydroxylase